MLPLQTLTSSPVDPFFLVLGSRVGLGSSSKRVFVHRRPKKKEVEAMINQQYKEDEQKDEEKDDEMLLKWAAGAGRGPA